MKQKKWLAAALGASLLLSMTACGMPWEEEDEDSSSTAHHASVEAEVESESEAESGSVSVGYITLTDGEQAVDLYEDTDSATVVTKMFDGDPITVYSIDGDWAKVGYGGMEGYVKLANVSFTEPASEAATAAATEAEQVAAETKAAEESQSGDVTVNIIFDLDDDGFKVARPVSYPAYKAESAARNAWCSVESAYIYAQPDTSSAKREANMLYYGDSLTVQGSVNGWYYIATDSGNGYDLHGYVSQSYITYGESPAAPENANASYGRVSVGSANVRSTPNKETDDNVLFTLHQGDEFQVLSYDGYWYKIVYNGTTCYISHKMVEVW